MEDKAFILEDKKIKSIIKCLSDAIGDDVKGCLRRENLTAEYAKRGAWNMVPLYDRDTGTIYTVMREERFKEIQRKHSIRKKAHYIDALVQSFNFDLNTEYQMSLFEEQNFSEEEIKHIVDDIIRGFAIGESTVKRYRTILFEEYNSELTAVRCCILDSSLQIVEEADWSKYIIHKESVVVDNVVDANESHTANIKLKDKAHKKAGRRKLVALKEKSKEQKV